MIHRKPVLFIRVGKRYYNMENNEIIQTTWIGDERTTLESHQMALEAVQAVKRLSNEYDTLTESRVVGLVIEFWIDTGSYACKRENRVDEELAKEHGFTIPRVGLFADYSEKENFEIWDEHADSDELKLNQEDDEPVRYVMSLTKTLKQSFDEFVDQTDNWHSRNKIELLSNMILEYENSIFSDRFDRLQTKELILRQLNGEIISPDLRTESYNSIFMGEFGNDISNKLIDAYEDSLEDNEYEIEAKKELNNGEIIDTKVDLRDIEKDDNVMINPNDYIDKRESINLPKTQKIRVPVTLSLIRKLIKDNLDGGDLTPVDYSNGLNMSRIVNHDYDNPTYIFDEYIIDELEIVEYKGDEYIFLDESQIPHELTISDLDRIRGKFKYMRKLERSVSNDRSIESAIINKTNISLGRVMIGGRIDDVKFAEHVSDSDLEHECDAIIDYLLDGLSQNSKLRDLDHWTFIDN